MFNLPPPTSPCTRRMQAASMVSVSLISASACRADKLTPVAAAAYALTTAAVKDGCSFASAVAVAQMQGACVAAPRGPAHGPAAGARSRRAQAALTCLLPCSPAL